MSKVLVTESSLSDIANAIRGKNGLTTTYKPGEMAAAIEAITSSDDSILKGMIDGSITSIEIPDGVTKIRLSAFFSCTLLATVTIPNSVTSIGSSSFANIKSNASITIDNTYNAISGKPWGATNATITWLRATMSTITITQSDNQTITVTTDDGTSHTSTFDWYNGGTFTVSVTSEDGYVAGTPSTEGGTLSGDITITATEAVQGVYSQPYTINNTNYNANNRWAIDIDGIVYNLYPYSGHGVFYFLKNNSYFCLYSSYSGTTTQSLFKSGGDIYQYLMLHKAELSLISDSSTYIDLGEPALIGGYSDYGVAYWSVSGTEWSTICNAFDNGEDILLTFSD